MSPCKCVETRHVYCTRHNKGLLWALSKSLPRVDLLYDVGVKLGVDSNVIDACRENRRSIIAVFIDSLVMISIEWSVTNKKRALKILDKFVTDWVNAKSMAQSVTNLSRIFSALFFYL